LTICKNVKARFADKIDEMIDKSRKSKTEYGLLICEGWEPKRMRKGRGATLGGGWGRAECHPKGAMGLIHTHVVRHDPAYARAKRVAKSLGATEEDFALFSRVLSPDDLMVAKREGYEFVCAVDAESEKPTIECADAKKIGDPFPYFLKSNEALLKRDIKGLLRTIRDWRERYLARGGCLEEWE